MSTAQLLPRSRLYRLSPQGLGTSLVESLTSFTSRLAEAHCVRVGVLLSQEVGPSISRRAFNVSQMWMQVGHTMNGQGKHARRCVHHLERLTHQEGLAKLTFLPWSAILGSTHLLRKHKAWCPLCLSEWKAADKIVYEPLLWACGQVEVCPIHNLPLAQRCPHTGCQAQLPALTSWPGYCPRCEGWLGYLPSDHSILPPAEETKLGFCKWTSDIVGDLLAMAGQHPCPYSPYHLQSALSACGRHMRRLTREYGRSPIPGYPFSRLKEMSSRTGAIQLDTLLHICYHLRITPSYFLTEYSLASHTMDVPPSPQRQATRQKPRRHHGSLQELGRNFGALLGSTGTTALSLAEVARRLDTTPSILRQYFRPLCDKLQARKPGHVDDDATKLEVLRRAARTMTIITG